MIRARHLLLAGLFVLSTTAFVDLHGQSKVIHVGSDRIENEYIVVLDDETLSEDVADIADDLVAGRNVLTREIWTHGTKGFFAEMSEEEAEELSLDSRVKYVEENAPWYYSSMQQTKIDPRVCDPVAGTCSEVVDNRLWHLDRADQNYASPTNSYSYCTNGTGVTVYVVDSGVNKHHNEFGPSGTRVLSGYNATDDLMPANDPCIGFALAPTGDYYDIEAGQYKAEIEGPGHGTAVAAALGGKRIGIAKNVTIVPVKVSRCDRASARFRIPNHSYAQNETMFRLPAANSPGPLYRAQNSGSTAITDSESWPTIPGQTKVDGGITWVVVAAPDTTPPATTVTLKNGLEWILANAVAGPKIVTMSVFRRATVAGVGGSSGTVEAAVRRLLDANITVIASANNQNGNACDTSPSRLSIGNPSTSLADDVITAGGSMIVNRPWTVDISDVSNADEADGGGTYGPEPTYSATLPVRDARWICGAGDSVNCSNPDAISNPDPDGNVQAYQGYSGGSNAGPCVTLFAPAKNIFVASPSSASGYRDARLHGTLASGTSWSAPIVAGFAARILQNNSGYTPADVRAALIANSVATLDTEKLHTIDHDTGNPILDTPNKFLRLSDVNITSPPASTPAAPSGTTRLSVVAAGTSTVHYQWYEVNSGFDYATNKNGAHSSTLISGATNSFYDAPASGTTRAYWVRVKNDCGSADSDIAVVVPRPAAPANTVATANLNTVEITWSAATGAEKYEIQHKVSGQAWTTFATVAAVGSGTQSYLHAPSSQTGMAVYRVLSAAGVAYLPPGGLAMSVPSNNDIANLDNDTYENLAVAPSFTTFKAQMVTELRQAANSLAAAAGISPMPYSSGDLDPQSLRDQTIAAAYLTSLMGKINDLRKHSLIGMSDVSWTLGEPQGNNLTLITRTYVEDLRNALK